MALKPFKNGPEIVIGEGWKMKLAEAGRSAQGLKATIVLANGTGRTRQTIALGQVKQQQVLVEHFAAFSGLEPQQLFTDLGQLSEAIEGAVRLEETHDQGARPRARETTGEALTFEDIEPWPAPVDGAAFLTQVAATYERHLVLPAGGAETLTLWTLHTYIYDLSVITPRLGITSPVKRCGKTRVLEALSLLTPRVLMSSSSTPAAIFRAIERWHPTLLIDEADTFLPGNEELRGILNSGYTRRSARILRTVGDAHEPRWFSTWAPMAIAMIGHLPGTLADRAIVLTPHQTVPPSQTSNDALKHDFQTVPTGNSGTDAKVRNPAPNKAWDGGTDQKGNREEKNHTRTHSDTSLFGAEATQPVCPECGGTEWVLAVTHRRCALCGAREDR